MTELPMTKLRLKQLYVTRFMKQEGLIKFVTLLEEMLENKIASFLKVGILGSRIPDIISEKFGHFWLKPLIGRFG